MIKKIGIVLILLIAVLLIFAATRPNSFRVERTATINAPPEKIFPLINDFHRWGSWSPYEKLDPAMKRNMTGAASGKGAVYEWEGNAKAGTGRMEITESAPDSRVAIQLDFSKPMEGHDVAEFTLEPRGGSTQVTWAMHGASPYYAKVIGVFFSMDRMIGTDFEAGLANLKRIAEG